MSTEAEPRPRVGRILDRLLLRDELAHLEQAAACFTTDRSEYLRRSRLAFEMGELALAPGSAVRSGSSVPLASNLFRQSLYWSLLAHGTGTPTTPPELVWAAADHRLLERMGASGEELVELGRLLRSTFIELAEGSVGSQQTSNALLRRCAKRLLRAVQTPLTALEWSRVKRLVRLLLLGCVVVVLLASVATLGVRLLVPADIAKGKPWRTSSTYLVCHPEKLDCGGTTTDILFHTNYENSPWVEYDLGAPVSFSSLTVKNRVDYGPELAVPLVAEVSDDAKRWREISRRNEVFAAWRPKFSTQHARFLRLRVLRPTYLHLRSVEVYP